MQHSKLMNRLEEIRDAEEGVRVAEAHLRYWQIVSDPEDIDRKMREQMRVIAEAQRQIERIRMEHAGAPARVAQCERRLAECQTQLKGLRSDKKLQQLLKLYQRLLDEHRCADFAKPFVYPNGVEGTGSVCSVCGATVE